MVKFIFSLTFLASDLAAFLCQISLFYRKQVYPKVLSIGALKTIDFSFLPNGKFMFLCVPIFKPNIVRL